MRKTFSTITHAARARFSVPKSICNSLGVKCENAVSFVVKDAAGSKLFVGVKYLKSGLEIYGGDIRQSGIRAGQRISVTVRRHK
jgi:hypothetical protein